MECIILTGPQASGKSTFYRERFFDTHIRINLDMLHTRQRELALLQTCLQTRTPFVVDNTNPTPADRARYIPAAKAAGFRIIGYYFQTPLKDCLARNAARTGKAHVPPGAILATFKRLQPPTYPEGFDDLYTVRSLPDGQFLVELYPTS